MCALLHEIIVRVACVPCCRKRLFEMHACTIARNYCSHCMRALLQEKGIRIACVPFFLMQKTFNQTNSNNSQIQMVVCIDFRI